MSDVEHLNSNFGLYLTCGFETIVERSPNIAANQLVGVTQVLKHGHRSTIGVGRMIVSGESLQSENTRGPSVTLLHTWKGGLWGSVEG
jgi:predicted ribosome-associated RNA-binding protein Tma20